MLKAGIYDPYLDTLGGGERYILTVAEVLLKQGYQVDLFWDGDQSLLTKAKEHFSLNLDGLNFTPDIFGLIPKSIDLVEDNEALTKLAKNSQTKTSFMKKLKKIINNLQITKRYDLFFYLSDGSLPLLFSKHNLLHAQVPFNFKPNFRDKIFNYFKILQFKEIICNSKFTARIIDSLYGKHSLVIYPPVDIDKFSKSNQKNIILSVGRFDNVMNAKKQDVLIEAFSKLLITNPQWKLVLAGGSLENPNKNSYLKHLKFISQNLPVEFVINPPFSELQTLYSQSKIYWHAAGFGVDQNLHPEETEHFGITVAEAMASGLVPLVANRGGLPEIITDNHNGFLWESIDDLIAKTKLLIATPKMYAEFSQNALESVALFSKAEFSRQFLKLLS
ncbi:MAG: glycosyltransferase family 4 protein [Candidatus Shapirobacteria bacterium]|nr:glycosyltransferase family 4 protein [Candidatus Shapirobacteria bacterium]